MTKEQEYALRHPAARATDHTSLSAIKDFPWSIILTVNK